jgi:hypothetical protein
MLLLRVTHYRISFVHLSVGFCHVGLLTCQAITLRLAFPFVVLLGRTTKRVGTSYALDCLTLPR